MTRLMQGLSAKTGAAPGTLIHVGSARADAVCLTVMDYDETSCDERVLQGADDAAAYRDTRRTAWIHVDGVHRVDLVSRLGECFGLHSLVLEDVLNTNQRPKLDQMEGYLYLVFRLLTWDEAAGDMRSEQVSLILGPRYVLSFAERTSTVFDPLRDRIRQGVGRIRKSGADYLAYALLDVVVDHYFVVLEKLDEEIENLETGLAANPTPAMLAALNRLKRQALFLRKSVWPLREAIASLQRRDSPLIAESTGLYLRDLYDHVVHVIDTIETLRDMLSGMLDIYLSSVSNRMNEVMKLLTVISTIFIPLTFLCGVYGMNFKHMPELDFDYGYEVFWGVMLLVALLLVAFFRRKRWL